MSSLPERKLKRMQDGVLFHTEALYALHDKLDEYLHQHFYLGEEIQEELDDLEKDIEQIEDRLNGLLELFNVPQRNTGRPTQRG